MWSFHSFNVVNSQLPKDLKIPAFTLLSACRKANVCKWHACRHGYVMVALQAPGTWNAPKVCPYQNFWIASNEEAIDMPDVIIALREDISRFVAQLIVGSRL